MDWGSVLSALLGGLLAFTGVVYTQRMASRAERRQRRDDGMSAALILQEDLAWARTRVRTALNRDKYWSARYALEVDSWIQLRQKLAVSLPDPQAWAAVRDGFRALKTLELQASRHRNSDTHQAPVNDWGKARLEESRDRIDAALAALDAIVTYPAREQPDQDPAEDDADAPASP
jgi:hypothetical protein